MRIEITPLEARVIGSLIEKEITTPDQYPLSLSALTNACNQKSSRHPVMQLSEMEVQDLLDGLRKKHLVSDRTGFGSRVAKFQHRFCNTDFGAVEFSPQELGVLCVLLLRGAQTPGELRSRTNRLCQFSDVQQTESVLEGLIQRKDGPFVARLACEPGKRESRYAHLFCGEVENPHALLTAEASGVQGPVLDDSSRLRQLEECVREMREELDALKIRIETIQSEQE
ncbi:MAG: DUF480 domain-containing protein [Candidatus Thiodiazotropha sp. (ex Epidulcina cf. delphinae)]|nr:DUF480 domain-containing protein [Candidatus Thiodiazotropha sp. (ex Epidulcina cf. delphinae)]